MLSRRSMFGASAAAIIASVPVASVASAVPDHSWFLAEAHNILRLTSAMNANPQDDALGEEWDRRFEAFLTRIEALPLTPENAPIRALGIAVIHNDDPDLEEFSEGSKGPTDMRLAGQMVLSLRGGLN